MDSELFAAELNLISKEEENLIDSNISEILSP